MLHLEKATPVLGCVFPYLRAILPLLTLMPKSTRNFSMIDSNSIPLCSFLQHSQESRDQPSAGLWKPRQLQEAG